MWQATTADQLTEKEVVPVAVQTPTMSERSAPEGRTEPEGEDTRRALALERIYRIRRFKLHLVAFALAIPALTGLWVLTEYFEEHTWPSRFASDPDVAGTWDPWLFFVAGFWLILLVIHALRTYVGPPIGPIGRYIRRPVTQAEVDREVERLESLR